jgi:hypothetical protein
VKDRPLVHLVICCSYHVPHTLQFLHRATTQLAHSRQEVADLRSTLACHQRKSLHSTLATDLVIYDGELRGVGSGSNQQEVLRYRLRARRNTFAFGCLVSGMIVSDAHGRLSETFVHRSGRAIFP